MTSFMVFAILAVLLILSFAVISCIVTSAVDGLERRIEKLEEIIGKEERWLTRQLAIASSNSKKSKQ